MRVERWTLNSGDVTTYVPWLAQNPPPTCFPSYVCLGRCPLGPLFKEKTRYLRSLSSIIDVFCPIVHYGSHQGGCGSVKDFTSYNPQRREAPLIEEPSSRKLQPQFRSFFELELLPSPVRHPDQTLPCDYTTVNLLSSSLQRGTRVLDCFFFFPPHCSVILK